MLQSCLTAVCQSIQYTSSRVYTPVYVTVSLHIQAQVRHPTEVLVGLAQPLCGKKPGAVLSSIISQQPMTQPGRQRCQSLQLNLASQQAWWTSSGCDHKT